MTVTRDAFDLLHLIANRRLARGRLTVVDATNVQVRARRPLLEVAAEHRRPTVAIIFDLPLEVCLERNRLKTGRRIPPGAIQRQQEQLHESLPGLRREGLCHIHILRTSEEVDAARIERPRV
jgi:protein phosphatase